MNKTTNAEINIRVNEIIELIVMGFTRADILQYVANIGKKENDDRNPWNVCIKTIDNYTRRARKLLEKSAKTITKRELGLAIRRFEDLFKRNLAIQDYKAALSVQKAKNELLGLITQTPPVDVNININTWDDLEKAVQDENKRVAGKDKWTN